MVPAIGACHRARINHLESVRVKRHITVSQRIDIGIGQIDGAIGLRSIGRGIGIVEVNTADNRAAAHLAVENKLLRIAIVIVVVDRQLISGGAASAGDGQRVVNAGVKHQAGHVGSGEIHAVPGAIVIALAGSTHTKFVVRVGCKADKCDVGCRGGGGSHHVVGGHLDAFHFIARQGAEVGACHIPQSMDRAGTHVVGSHIVDCSTGGTRFAGGMQFKTGVAVVVAAAGKAHRDGACIGTGKRNRLAIVARARLPQECAVGADAFINAQTGIVGIQVGGTPEGDNRILTRRINHNRKIGIE